jgi:hypothetical protein
MNGCEMDRFGAWGTNLAATTLSAPFVRKLQNLRLVSLWLTGVVTLGKKQ